MQPPDPGVASAALREHLDDCARARGRCHAVSGVLQSVHALLRPRLVSTLLVLLAVMAGVLWLA